MEPSPPQTSPLIPIAIIGGFAMIALAILLTGNDSGESITDGDLVQNSEHEALEESVSRTVDSSDYIRGNPNAPIMMVEYSDYDCPFCKQFHTTMNQIMDEYGITGQLGWVYRQFPLAQLHPNSPGISEAALCVGDIGGNDAFWTFSDLIFEGRAIDAQTNVTKLPQYAVKAGIAEKDFTSCLDSGRMRERVEADIKDGFNSGVRGTPYTILTVGDQQAVIKGGQPYHTVKGIVSSLIDQLEGNFDYSRESVEMPLNDRGVPILE
ncbi:MAG: protein-disulfide isomerase [Candidatus Paceibacteria bacterium]|jgi:protein-disulfide isomerase